jgi:hypothetical protein
MVDVLKYAGLVIISIEQPVCVIHVQPDRIVLEEVMELYQ